ncbi:MAG TPA: tetratricopeptide repeat protein [Bdellovibrionota bacterium]|nr:tetratricopeptide repeat protein [Bdellovibrionota bacterium]
MKRKELLQKDQFLTMSGRIIHHIETQSKYYGLGLLALILTVLSVLGWSTYQNHREKKASDAYFLTLKQIDEARVGKKESKDIKLEDLQKPISSLKDVVDKYASTVSGVLASLKLGNLYYEYKQFDQAMLYFKKAKKYAKDKTLLFNALYNVAYAHESLGQYEEAKNSFEELSFADVEFWALSGYLGKGRCFEKLGHVDKAKEAYESLKQKYPQYQQKAEEYLLLMSYEKK